MQGYTWLLPSLILLLLEKVPHIELIFLLLPDGVIAGSLEGIDRPSSFLPSLQEGIITPSPQLTPSVQFCTLVCSWSCPAPARLHNVCFPSRVLPRLCSGELGALAERHRYRLCSGTGSSCVRALLLPRELHSRTRSICIALFVYSEPAVLSVRKQTAAEELC